MVCYRMVLGKKRMYRRKRSALRRSRKSAKSGVGFAKAVKRVLMRNVETKCINAPHNGIGPSNTLGQPYPANTGLIYLAKDIFAMPQGSADSTAVSATNRVGDRINAKGFLMNYTFQPKLFYTVGTSNFYIPFVKIRVTAFQANFGVGNITDSLLYDNNVTAGAGTTLKPINWGSGYIKSVLYDKVFVVTNNASGLTGGTTSVQVANWGKCLHFRKYINLKNKVIDYADNSSTSPNATRYPIMVVVSGEYDDYSTITPTGTTLFHMTGATVGWFKDA